MHIFQLTHKLLIAVTLLLSTTLAVQAEQNKQTLDSNISFALNKLEELAEKQIKEKSVVGLAIAVIYKDKVIFAKGFGKREIGKEDTVNSDTVFQLASVSKPLSATVIAALVGEGKITWDSKISDLDPEFQMYDDYITRELTIRDLYAHRSGLPVHAGDYLEDMGYNRQQILYRLRFQKPENSFRSHYAYTNFGLTEAAIAAAKSYNLSWEEASEKFLFKPLAMTHTSSKHSDFLKETNKALGHVLIDKQWQQKYIRNPDAQSPAGGISASINDMAKWLRLILAKGQYNGKQIIAEKPLLEIQHPQILTQFNPFNNLPSFYGLGMNVSYDEQGRLRLGHSGAFALGNATAISIIPNEQLAIVVLTNSFPVGVAEALNASFIDNALYHKETQDWLGLFKKIFADPSTLGLDQEVNYESPLVNQSPALPNASYLGTYTNQYYGNIIISEKNNNLIMEEGPHNFVFPLKHYDRDTFTYLTPGENSSGLSSITFSIGPNKKAKSILIENLNKHGQGTFFHID